MSLARYLSKITQLLNSSGQVLTGGIADSAVTIGKVDTSVSQLFGMRNKLINGDMRVIQRGATTTNIGQDAYGACDRWKQWAADGSETGRCTMSQSTDVPSGQPFKYSKKLQVTTAQTSLASTAAYKLVQRIEANNCWDLGFGAAGYVAVSFWAKVENKPGTYCVSFWLYGQSSNKVLVREVSLTTSWAKYTLILPTDATQNIVTGNGTGIEFGIGLMAGSGIRSGSTSNDWVAAAVASTFTANQVNFYDSTSNALYLTGAQFEKGSVVTPFENRLLGLEDYLCKRYYQSANFAGVPSVSGYAGWAFIQSPMLCPNMRAAPTVTYDAGPVWYPGAVAFTPTTDNATTNSITIVNTAGGGGNAYYLTWKASAEL